MDYFPLLVARLHFLFLKKFKCVSNCKSKKMSLSICRCLEKSNPVFLNTWNLKSNYLIASLAERGEKRITSKDFYQVLFLLEDLSRCSVYSQNMCVMARRTEEGWCLQQGMELRIHGSAFNNIVNVFDLKNAPLKITTTHQWILFFSVDKSSFYPLHLRRWFMSPSSLGESQ